MLKKIGLIVVFLLAAILIFAAFKPGDFHVQRTVTIQAPPEKIFPLINDFHNWPSWSPFEKLDRNMKRTLSGTPSGQGTVYEWEGNSQAGKGRMEITQSVPSAKIAIKLDFMKPMEGHDIAEFTLQPKGNSTDVTWALSGPLTYPGKVMTVFVSMDKMIGDDFEAGLATMKTVAER
jgi:uncharacterized protein YndB with AHSA1/START domain